MTERQRGTKGPNKLDQLVIDGYDRLYRLERARGHAVTIQVTKEGCDRCDASV